MKKIPVILITSVVLNLLVGKNRYSNVLFSLGYLNPHSHSQIPGNKDSYLRFKASYESIC